MTSRGSQPIITAKWLLPLCTSQPPLPPSGWWGERDWTRIGRETAFSFADTGKVSLLSVSPSEGRT